MTGILLALAASGAWGVSDFLGGLRTRTVALPLVLLLSQGAGLLLVLGFAARGIGGDVRYAGMPASALAPAALAGAAGVLALGLLYLAMARGGMSLVAPVSAAAAAVPVVIGLLDGDPLGLRTGLGVALALAGALAAVPSRKSSMPSGDASPARARRDAVTLLAATGSALSSGAFFVLIRLASDGSDPLTAVLANRICGCALVAAWALGCRPDLRALRHLGAGGLTAVAAVGMADAVAELCFALASTREPLSIVTPLSSLYPAVAVTLALLVLRERLGRIGGAGVACAVAGVVLLGG
jgi:drug/metabolite transporter (DMT)-like permease